jgi:general secretion pathway protein A
MYEAFYGLETDPFRLSADHRFCFSHRSYARAKSYVRYALHRAEGFVLITGRPGTGKTTLVSDLLASLPSKEVVAGTLVSTQLEAKDLLLMTGHVFGLDFPSTQKALVLQRLMDFLNQQDRQGLRTLLIIDEAQDLAPSALEELRLLTNLQRNGRPLIQIALLGQDALADMLHLPEMEQVLQRLIAAWHLEPLDLKETVGYVRHRLEVAGWRGDPAFEPGVLKLVHEFSHGIPRRINLICSRLLLHGCISELHSLTAEDARTLIQEMSRERLALGKEEPIADPNGDISEDVPLADSAAPAPGVEEAEEIDEGLFGPTVETHSDDGSIPPPAAPAEPTGTADKPDASAQSAPQPTEPVAIGERESEGAPPQPSFSAVEVSATPVAPEPHWRHMSATDDDTPAVDSGQGEARTASRRNGWIKALLLLAALVLAALALSYSEWIESALVPVQDWWDASRTFMKGTDL